MHMLLVIAFLEKVNYGGNFSPPKYEDGLEKLDATNPVESVNA